MARALTVQTKFRTRRFRIFADVVARIPDLGRPIRILDIGGEQDYWRNKKHLLTRDFTVTLVNLKAEAVDDPRFTSLVGDARAMPQFGDGSFDVVHSNSVIEHVGRWTDMMAMAKEVRRIAPAFYLQTPYFWFPMEPHARTLFLHWLPESLRFRVVMARKCGFWSKCKTVDAAMRTIQSGTLLDKRMFAELFPDAEMVHERIYGLTKSLVGVRHYPR